MALSSIQTNLAALINKAYNIDTSTAASTAAAANPARQEAPAKPDTDTDTVNASALVTLGETGSAPEIYTAQGLLQQMRQIQLSNTMVLYGNENDHSQDSSGYLAIMSSELNAEAEAISQV